ncbi:sensor protein CitS [Lachnospiraceae bacterium]|nr:sensor protein CitS [Lachnospiraceae bacterium]
MITNVCLLLEMLSIVLCLRRLYGEKFRFDIVTVSFLSVYMIIMTAINYYGLPKIYTLVTYILVFGYCGVKFRFCIKTIILNHVLCMIIIGAVQLVVMISFYYSFDIASFNEMTLLYVNIIAFMLLLFILSKFNLSKLSVYLQDKERILLITLLISIAVTTYIVIGYKHLNIIELNQSLLLFISISFICILAMQLSKYRVKSKEIETELKMHKLYAESFQSLIENIRMRQHEFDNHINTIYNQHYMYNTYEELVNAQKDYCHVVVQENRYNKLLTSGNPILIGFLYGKFVEIEKHNIEILYTIGIEDFNVGVPIYKMVEIIGNLVDNAVEALENSILDKVLFVSVVEIKDIFEIEVRNRSEFIDHNEIDSFFRKGYSKKGKNRGLGLYNVKNICNEYSICLFCENKYIDDESWFSFTINNKKRA